MRLKSTTLGALFLMFLLVAQTAPLTVTNDVNTTMLTSETNGEDSFSVSARNGSSWSSPASIDYPDDVGYHPSLAIDSNDHLHVTYVDNTNGNLEYMTHDGSSWSTPISPDNSGNMYRFSDSSLAIDSNDHLHVTYLDYTNGNLEYMTHDGSSWSTPVSLDSTDDVGRYSSLAIDSNNNLHVTYYDATNSDLEYMTYDGSSWSVPISLDSRSYVGYQSSLAIDSNDNLHVTYRDIPNASLEYMIYDGFLWSTPISLDSNSGSDDYIGAPSLAIDFDDRLHVTYYDDETASLEYMTYDGSSWSIPYTLNSQCRGLDSSLAIDSNNHLHVTYHCDIGRNTLEYISYNDSSWSTRASIDNSAHRNTGYHPSLAIDSNDNLHVTYYNWTGGNLDYMTSSNSAGGNNTGGNNTGGNTSQVWSSPVTLDSHQYVGLDSSLAIDSNDNLHVTYLDQTNWNLEYMAYDGFSWSAPVSLDSTGYVGKHSSLAIDSNDNLHVTYLDETT